MKLVYVIYNDTFKLTKIGITSNILTRLRNLECGCGVPLQLKHCTIPIANAAEIEKKMHLKFDEYRTVGEWFAMPPTDCIKELKNISSSYMTENYINELVKGVKPSIVARNSDKSRQYLERKKKEWNLDHSNITKESLADMVKRNEFKIKLKRAQNK